MEVILKEDVNKLGHRGDVVTVKDGYGRNYLLPSKLAMEATVANKAVIEQMKSSAIRRSSEISSLPLPSGALSSSASTIWERSKWSPTATNRMRSRICWLV